MEIKSNEIDSYKKINMIFIVLIMFIFFYCLLLPYLNFGFRSSCEGMPLSYCRSRGLTRAFSQILRFNLDEAIQFNPYSLKIFSFFLMQLILRFLINKSITISNLKPILIADIVFSIGFFLFSFYNLILI